MVLIVVVIAVVLLVTMVGELVSVVVVVAIPSKCQKFYTSTILGEKNLRQKVRKCCPNLNRDKMTYLIK